VTGDEPQRAFAAAPGDPEELEAQAGPSDSEISASTTLGVVSLTVSDLARSTTYYQSAVGLQLIEHGDGHTLLGVAGRGLLRLTELAGAWPVGRHTGSTTLRSYWSAVLTSPTGLRMRRVIGLRWSGSRITSSARRSI
jgi:catechol 2,3-dioxygenase-like lactoylglutathione lyase family enzyme